MNETTFLFVKNWLIYIPARAAIIIIIIITNNMKLMIRMRGQFAHTVVRFACCCKVTLFFSFNENIKKNRCWFIKIEQSKSHTVCHRQYYRNCCMMHPLVVVFSLSFCCFLLRFGIYHFWVLRMKQKKRRKPINTLMSEA